MLENINTCTEWTTCCSVNVHVFYISMFHLSGESAKKTNVQLRLDNADVMASI